MLASFLNKMMVPEICREVRGWAVQPFQKRKLLKVYTILLKNHLTAVYPYIRIENSSTGCTSILVYTYTMGFLKCFDIAVFCSF